MADERQNVPLDRVDRRMLAVLQEEGRIPNAALAERLHLSPSPCLRRLRALEKDGVIKGYGARLDRERLGLGLTVFIDLKVDSHSEETAGVIAKALLETPEVVSAHVVSGDADIRIEAVVPDLGTYERLLFGKILALPHVVDARSNFVLRTIKAGAPLPV
jgi:Lrp/AsnC family transcriptional regulator, leucine-responsive regulatory protein